MVIDHYEDKVSHVDLGNGYFEEKTVVDAAKSSGHDQNPSWPELKLKDSQRAGSKKEYYSVTTTYQGKKGKTKTEKYNIDFSEWKKLKKGEEMLKINFNGFAEINNKK